MKNLIYLLLVSLCVNINAQSQHRLEDWDASKITSVKIEDQSSESKLVEKIFDNKEDITKIISFLKKVEFEPYSESRSKKSDNDEQWLFKIVCEGQRDWIYIYTDVALVGKSIYFIDDRVSKDFEKLLNRL